MTRGGPLAGDEVQLLTGWNPSWSDSTWLENYENRLMNQAAKFRLHFVYRTGIRPAAIEGFDCARAGRPTSNPIPGTAAKWRIPGHADRASDSFAGFAHHVLRPACDT